MKKISFIGVYDKTDLVLYISKVLKELGNKILVVDATTNQKARYVVPVINPTKTYITDFDGIDVAVGFEDINDIKKYLGIQENEDLDYDYLMVDTDNLEGILKFQLQSSDKNYFVASFDVYSLKKGIEILNQINIPLHMTRIFYSKEMLKEEEEYFDYLSLGIKVVWEEEKIYFLLENGDQPAIFENQRIEKIKFKNLSNEYRENVVFLIRNIDKNIEEKKIRNIIKNI